MKSKSWWLLLITAVLYTSLNGQDETWKLRKDKDGIRVYTKAVEWSKYNEYKVEATMDGTISAFYALFKDFDTYTELFKDVKSIDIKLNTLQRHITYLVNKTPFPAKDRDLVLDNRFTYDAAEEVLKIDLICTGEYYVPSKKYVQIKTCYGTWMVQQLNDRQVFVKHQFVADPGGRIPAFIVNIKTVQNPMKVMMALRELIRSPKYEDQSLFLSFAQTTEK